MDISADVLPFLSKSFFTRIAEIANECVHFWWLCRCCCGQISGQFWINEIFQERFWICSIPCFQEKRWETKSIFSCFDTIQQSKGHLCRCARLLSLTAGLACLSKNLPPPTSLHCGKTSVGVQPRAVLTLDTSYQFCQYMKSAKVHDWSKWSCAIDCCYKWPQWHSVGLAPKWNHLSDPKSLTR